ncbi:CAP domain-containing protein [Cellulomonas persica]
MPVSARDPRRRDLRRHRRWRRARATRRRLLAEATATLTLAVAAALGVPLLLGPSHDEVDIGAAVVELVGDRPTGDAAGRGPDRTASRSAGRGEPSTTADPAPSASPSSDADASATAPAQDAARAATSPAAEPTSAHPAAPTSAPTTAPTSRADEPDEPSANTAYAEAVVELTNAARREAGLAELAVSPCATEQAVSRAAVLVAEDRFEHDPLDPVVKSCAAGAVGENLALGYPDAQAAVEGWLASTGHRENILRPGYTSIGVGCVTGEHGPLCAQVFLG